jgi:BlaI family transcriptional regulator, penicillinase repressor
MKDLTSKEEEIMQFFWTSGPLFVKQLVEKYPESKPHFNTLSTYVRALEEKGFLAHESFGTTYRYFPIIQAEEYQNRTLKDVIKKYFNNSYIKVVSSLIESENISVAEITKLLDEVEKSENKK